MTKRAEQSHSNNDLGRRNKAAKKMTKYRIKSAQAAKKALRSGSESEKLRYENKAARMEFKASKKQIDANRISKTTGYGLKAMQYSIKSDKIAKKAAKTRLKLANNQRYIEMTKRKMYEVQNDEKLKSTAAELRKQYSEVFE